MGRALVGSEYLPAVVIVDPDDPPAFGTAPSRPPGTIQVGETFYTGVVVVDPNDPPAAHDGPIATVRVGSEYFAGVVEIDPDDPPAAHDGPHGTVPVGATFYRGIVIVDPDDPPTFGDVPSRPVGTVRIGNVFYPAAVVVSGSGGGGGIPTGLTRTTAGLVHEDDFNRADESPIQAPWVQRIGTTWVLDVERIEIVTQSAERELQDTTATDQGEMFLQAALGWAGGTDKVPGILARYDFTSRSGIFLGISGGGAVVMRSRIDGENAASIGTEVVSVSANVLYPVQLYVADGVQEARVPTLDVTFTAADENQDGQNARGAGVYTVGSSIAGWRSRMDDWLWCRSKNVTVSGLPAGWKAKIRNGSAEVVAEATASGGSAVIDASMHGDATELVPLAGWADIAITDGDDVVQFVHDANPIYPGDTYVAA